MRTMAVVTAAFMVLISVGVATEGCAQIRLSPVGPGFSAGGTGTAGASITGNNITVTPSLRGLDVNINSRIYQAPRVDVQTTPKLSISPSDDGRTLRRRIGDDDERSVNRATISRPAAGGGPPPGSHGGETPHAHVHSSANDGDEDCYYYTSDRHWHCYKTKK